MKLSKQKAMEALGKTMLAQKAVVVKDPRFSRLHSDPRFQRAFKRKLKIPIDSRFSHIFSDKQFSDPLALDKRGRKPKKHSNQSSKKRHALHQYYRLHDDDEVLSAGTHSDGHTACEARFSKGIQNGEKPRSEAHQNALQSGKTQKLKSLSSKKMTKKESHSSEALPPRADKGKSDINHIRSSFKGDSKEKEVNAESTSEEELNDGTVQDEDSESEDDLAETDASQESSETSSTSSSSSEYSDDDEDMADSPSEEAEAEAEKVPTTDTETRRLALVNMDWEHIRAVDILAVMNSFLPKGGQIVSVSVSPSEFGLQQMKEEEQRGPQGLFQPKEDDDDNDDADDGVNMEKLRKYEKDKLKYYYAVVECDSVATGDFLYRSCDGMEFERTSNMLDMRFIPDHMKFLNDARDVARQVPADYQAPVFETRALQHSKVKLTWDDDEPDRVKSLHQKFNAEQLNEMDFKAYLASDASDSEVDEDVEGDAENDHAEGQAHPEGLESNKTSNSRKGSRDRYRALLLGSEEASEGKDSGDDDDQDMEITFHSGLEELSKRLMDKTKQKDGDETVWEAYLRKKKEKKKLQKQGQTAQVDHADDDSASEDNHDTQGDAGFDDPFFQSSEGVDLAASDGSDSEREVVPVARQKKSLHAQKRAELEKKRLEEERSRAELELLFADEVGAGNGVKGYNLKKKLKGKRKEKEMLPDKLPMVNYDDPRFSALFTSHRFALDPTEPEFKRSAAQLRSLLEKQQKHLPQVREVADSKRPEPAAAEEVAKVATAKKAKQELSSMVRSLKRKVGGREHV